MKYFIKTFGCQQNIADSERLAAYYASRGFSEALDENQADLVVVNTCVVKERAENKIYGYVKNLKEQKASKKDMRVVVTGCLVGTAVRDTTGKTLKAITRRMPLVDEFLPMEEVGFEYIPIRKHNKHAWVVISNGCNNFCTYCIVPFSRGREASRPFEDIMLEINTLAKNGYTEITLLGQNVNSFGSDLVAKARQRGEKTFQFEGATINPTFVKHLGRMRIPTLFPQLLERVAQTPGLEKISFVSANPWDFSDDLIRVMAENKNIDRVLHLPVQHGDDVILKKMNRWYTRAEYLELVSKIKQAVPDILFTTDIIVGFPGEDEASFQKTVSLIQEVGFIKAFVSQYSPRRGTAAEISFQDEVPHEVKVQRFHILDDLIKKISPQKVLRSW